MSDSDSDGDFRMYPRGGDGGSAPRRSSRSRKAQNFSQYFGDEDDKDLIDSDEERELKEREEEEREKADLPKVEKLLGIRRSADNSPQSEFLVKWKGKSYLHVSWMHENALKALDRRIIIRTQKFKNQVKANKLSFVNDAGEMEYFDPRFTEVDKILDEKEVVEEVTKEEVRADLEWFVWLGGKVTDEESMSDLLLAREREEFGVTKKVLRKMYLVKWCELSYLDATYEYEEDIQDDFKIALFHRINRVPTNKNEMITQELEMLFPGLKKVGGPRAKGPLSSNPTSNLHSPSRKQQDMEAEKGDDAANDVDGTREEEQADVEDENEAEEGDDDTAEKGELEWKSANPTARLAPVASRFISERRATAPVTVPSVLSEFVHQSEVTGLFIGDEVIAVHGVNVQSYSVDDTSNLLAARLEKMRSNPQETFVTLTFRRFVKRIDKPGEPVETVLFNINFKPATLGILLRNFQKGASYLVPRPALAPQGVAYIDKLLAPVSHKGELNLPEGANLSLRTLILGFFCNLFWHCWENHTQVTLEAIAGMIGIEEKHLRRWLAMWRIRSTATSSDLQALGAVENKLWDWLARSQLVMHFATYGKVSQERLLKLLAMHPPHADKVQRRIMLIFSALAVLKNIDNTKRSVASSASAKRRKQLKEAQLDSHGINDNFRVHTLVKVAPILDDIIAKVEAENGQGQSKDSNSTTADADSLDASIVAFDGPPRVECDSGQEKVFRWVTQAIRASYWINKLRKGEKIVTKQELDAFQASLRRMKDPAMRNQALQAWDVEQRRKAWAKLVSEMPLSQVPFIGEVPVNLQLSLMRDLKQAHEKELEEQQQKQQGRTSAPTDEMSSRLPRINEGFRQRTILLNKLRSTRFIPYTIRSQPRFKHGNMLREYQLNGVNWILQHWYKNISCILADEMGLGKTVQVVATLEHLRTKANLRGPYLIVAPLSTIGHWNREIETWTDMNLCRYYDSGGAPGRELIRKHEWYYPGMVGHTRMLKFNVMVTTYETFIADVDELALLPWLGVVVDEGHRLRSAKSKLLEQINRIKDANRLLLTGTPLQNNILELFSLLHFCAPTVFPDQDLFMDKYGEMRTKAQLDQLQQEIAPFMLRRVKEDVEKSIPPKEETIIDIELTMLQKRYYRAIFDKNRQILYKGCSSGNRPQLINVEMELRKCCNHPYLISGVQDNEYSLLKKEVRKTLGELSRTNNSTVAKTTSTQVKASGMEDDEESNEDETEQVEEDADEELVLKRIITDGYEKKLNAESILNEAELERCIRSSGKMVLVDKLLPKLRAEGHKVLIFSQFVRMLDLLQYLCQGRGYPVERLDGSVQGNKRQAAIDRFSDPSGNSFVFLLSTRAGGVGINLTAADTVIIFDSDWNPQNDAQAQARVHRIGQTKAVKIFRLVTKSTYEETMLQRAAKKLGLERAVLGGVHKMSHKGGKKEKGVTGKDVSVEELEKMLREGAYHHLKDDDGTAAKTFVGADIDELLKTNARTVVVEAAGGGSSGSNALDKLKHNTVNKSSFKAEREDGVDVNDPNFWQKVLPDMATPDSLLSKLNDHSQASGLALHESKRKAFMEDVRSLVRDIVEQRNAGEIINEHDMETTNALLVQISNMRNTFGKDSFKPENKKTKPFTELASRWLQRLEALRERRARRGATADDLDDDLFSDPGSDEDEMGQKQAEVDGKKRHSSKYADWTENMGPQDEFFSDDDVDESAEDEDAMEEDDEEEEEVPEVLMKDHMTEVCAICSDGGELIVCEGPCCRAFHMKCLDAASRKKAEGDDEWFCPDCENGCHSCCLCGKTGYTKVEGGVVACSDENCGRFHHLECIEASEHGKVLSTDPPELLCPLHVCEVCGEEETTVHCIQCWRGFHARCLDHKHSLRLHTNLVICPAHLEGKEFPIESHFPFDRNLRIRSKKGKKRRGRPKSTAGKRGRPSRSSQRKSIPSRKHVSPEKPSRRGRPPSNSAAAPKRDKNGPDLIDTDWRSAEGLEEDAVVLRTCQLCTQDGKVYPLDSGESDSKAMVPYPFLQTKGRGFSKIWVHQSCATLSPEVFLDDQQLYHNVLKAVRRGRFISCAYCNQRGATVGCFRAQCSKSFHIPCAIESGWDPDNEMEFLCELHRENNNNKANSSSKKRKGKGSKTPQQQKPSARKATTSGRGKGRKRKNSEDVAAVSDEEDNQGEEDDKEADEDGAIEGLAEIFSTKRRNRSGTRRKRTASGLDSPAPVLEGRRKRRRTNYKEESGDEASAGQDEEEEEGEEEEEQTATSVRKSSEESFSKTAELDGRSVSVTIRYSGE